MPGKPNNIIGNLRQRYEPHMKLSAKVDFNHDLIHGIEGKLRDLPKIHKTLSKSFGMQRKTLLRVIELEKQTDAITIIIENIQDGLEDAIDRNKRRKRRRGRPSAKKPPKTPHTPKDWDEEVPGDWDRTTGGTPEGEIGEPDEVILDGDPMGDPDGTMGDPDGTIGDPEGDKEPAIFGEPELGIDPDTDLQPIEDLPPEDPVDGTPDTPDTPGTPDDVILDGTPDTPDDKDVILDGTPDTPDKDLPTTDTGGIRGISEEQEAYNTLVSQELKSIHSTISTLTGHTSTVLRRVIGVEKRVSSNEKKITLLKNIIESQQSNIGEELASLDPVKSPLNESLQSIADSVTSIHETLLEQQDIDKDQADDVDVDAEQDKRDAKEKGREKGGIGEGLKKTGQKILKPVKGAFDRIKEWLIKFFAAKAIMMFMKWFSDPANKKKVASLFRFIKDWWPAIVTGLLLFAGSVIGPTGIFIAVAALVVGFIPKIINAVKSIFGFGKDASKEAEKGEKLANKSEKLADKQDRGSGGDDIKPDDVSEAPEPGSTPLQPPAQEFNKGGKVPGEGDKDTVPAMLTPGEFVLTKDAVEKYGTDTLEGMNAAAGGTNNPKEIKPGFKGNSLASYGGGGSVQPNKLFGYSGGGEVKAQVEEKKESGPKLNKETGNLARRIEPLITSQEAKSPLMSLVDKHPMVMMFKGIMRNPIIQNIITNVGSALGGGDKEDPELDLKKAIEDLQKRFNYSIYDGNYKTGGAVAGENGADGSDGAAGSSGGSGPLGGFIAAISSIPFIGKPIAMATGLLVNGLDDMIQEKHDSLHLAKDQKGTATPDAPTPPTTTVSYQKAQSAATKTSGANAATNGKKVPAFSASAKVDKRKVKVLGISR